MNTTTITAFLWCVHCISLLVGEDKASEILLAEGKQAANIVMKPMKTWAQF